MSSTTIAHCLAAEMRGRYSGRWAICFLPNDGGFFIRGRPPFQHVIALQYHRELEWLIFEWGIQGLRTEIWTDEQALAVLRMATDRGIVLAAEPKVHRRRLPPLLATCATLVGDLLGLGGWIWTPSGLYHAALRAGAIVLWDVRRVQAHS